MNSYVLSRAILVLLFVASTAGAAGTALLNSGPVCDIFANGYDSPPLGPCASCFDATTDFGESDVDCGGAYCKTCSAGQQCTTGSDCQSGICNGNVCAAASLLISQIRTRGVSGSADEFVELYNPAAVPIVFDSSWSLLARSSTAATLTSRYTGVGQIIPSHGHLLLVGSGYAGAVAGDAPLVTGIVDAGSVVLQHSSTAVDALCFYFDATTLSALSTHTCEGTPVSNLPHNNGSTGSSNSDVSLERKPGGALGNTQDTGDSATDFSSITPSNPHNLASTPVP